LSDKAVGYKTRFFKAKQCYYTHQFVFKDLYHWLTHKNHLHHFIHPAMFYDLCHAYWGSYVIPL